MGNNNPGKQLPQNQQQIINDTTKKVAKKVQQSAKAQSKIVESKQQTQYKLPEDLHDREKVRTCINKYNEKIEQQMKKQYMKDFFSMREKLLASMQNTCKQSYPVPKGKIGKELKQCMQSVQMLVSQQDERMQVEFSTKMFLLADKCLMKQERVSNFNPNPKDKAAKKDGKPIDPINKCVDKLLKYRNLNMEMHILKLELAREML